MCGSVARLEAAATADLDYMIIYPGELPADRHEFRQLVERTIESVAFEAADGKSVPFGKPNPEGVFARDVCGPDLVRLIGTREEHYDNISRRLLLLLEAQALWNVAYFDSLRDALIGRYAADVAADPSKQFVLLMNDIIRYFRTICVNYHAVTVGDRGKWPLRNIKLRHSRIVMYASLLYSLGELSRFAYARRDASPSKIDSLKQYVQMPPLERFAHLYTANGDDNFFRFLSLYNNFLAAMGDADKRNELRDLDPPHRYESTVFSLLKANSDAFASEVMRFLMARRGVWSDRFFEYLVL